MKRASYRDAVRWMVYNDDTEWTHDEEPIISVTAALVADMFDVEQDKIISDIRRALKQDRRYPKKKQ